jgi:hypothetical protein
VSLGVTPVTGGCEAVVSGRTGMIVEDCMAWEYVWLDKNEVLEKKRRLL